MGDQTDLVKVLGGMAEMEAVADEGDQSSEREPEIEHPLSDR